MILSMVGGGGGVDVQVKTGSITTGTDGKATVSCGFKPDLVVFFISNFTDDGERYENVVCLPIAESKQSNGAYLSTAAYADNTMVAYIDCWVESITSTGVKVGFYKNAQSGAGYVSRKTYNWTAVKYTA
ncbi:MAG: hypothetical protein PUD16_04560 [bacterium]|nr:hypothetical protein [bacterium]